MSVCLIYMNSSTVEQNEFKTDGCTWAVPRKVFRAKKIHKPQGSGWEEWEANARCKCASHSVAPGMREYYKSE